MGKRLVGLSHRGIQMLLGHCSIAKFLWFSQISQQLTFSQKYHIVLKKSCLLFWGRGGKKKMKWEQNQPTNPTNKKVFSESTNNRLWLIKHKLGDSEQQIVPPSACSPDNVLGRCLKVTQPCSLVCMVTQPCCLFWMTWFNCASREKCRKGSMLQEEWQTHSTVTMPSLLIIRAAINCRDKNIFFA